MDSEPVTGAGPRPGPEEPDPKSLLPLVPVSWGADPLFWTSPKLFVSQVLASLPVPGFDGCWLLHGHPILTVEIMGLVVGWSFFSDKDKYALQVDDGTGVLRCQWFQAGHHPTECEFGSLVHVRGKLQRRPDGALGLNAYTIRKVSDPNEEALHWLEVMHLTERCYRVPRDPPLLVAPHLPAPALAVAPAMAADAAAVKLGPT